MYLCFGPKSSLIDSTRFMFVYLLIVSEVLALRKEMQQKAEFQEAQFEAANLNSSQDG